MKNIVLTIFLLCCLPFSAAFAQSAIETRVQIAAQQSAMGHRLVRAMCFAQAGIDINTNTKFVQETRQSIDQAVHAMVHGGGPQNLSPETDATVITLINTLEMVWKPLRKGSDSFIFTGNISTEDLLKLSHKALSLEKMWGNLLFRMEAKSAGSGTQEKLDLMRMARVAGQQNKHLQAAGKFACLEYLQNDEMVSARIQAQLQLAVAELELNIFSLTFSNSELGLPVPPSEDIQHANFEHWQDWVYLSGSFTSLAVEKPDEETLRNLSYDIEILGAGLNETSELYRQHAIAQAFASFGFDFGG